MPIAFPSDEWIAALMDELNRSEAYREAAREWEGDICFVATTGPNAPVQLYMDLWHGECRAARRVSEPLARPPEFTLAGPLEVWRSVIEGRLDPIQAIVTRKLTLTGPLVKVARAPKAATALVDCCRAIETAWPDP